MLWIAAAVSAAATGLQAQPQALAAPVVQARATVRILKAAKVSWNEQTADAPPLKSTQVRLAGVSHPAKLVEFE